MIIDLELLAKIQMCTESFLRAVHCDDYPTRLFTPNYSTMNVWKKSFFNWPVTVTIRRPVRIPMRFLEVI